MLETICDVLVEGYKRNWSTSRDSNVSIRYYDRDHFYITPTGVRKQTLQPDQFKKIKVLGNTWEDRPYTDISANLRPSGELPLHFGLQKKLGQHDNDVRVVVHLHPT
jgi:L-fuculose-phosphate aldolase